MVVGMRIDLNGADAVKDLFDANKIASAHERGLRASLKEMERQSLQSANDKIYQKSRSGSEGRTRQYLRSLRIGGPGNIAQVNVAGNSITFGTDVAHAIFIEDGTPPHEIVPVNGKALSFTPVVGRATGGAALRKGAKVLSAGSPLFRGARGAVSSPGRFSNIVVNRVHHPGTKALHVLGDAATGVGRDAILNAYVTTFANALERRR